MLPVERFMRDYFQHTTAVREIAGHFVEGARPRAMLRRLMEQLLSRQVEGDFRVGPTEISALPKTRPKLQGDLVEVLRLLGLEDKLHHKPLELSGGEQQRVALARAVVTRPAIVLADEPTGNLDSENSALVLNMFQELNYRVHQTIVMITHNPEAAAMCKRIVQMRDGHIVESSPSVRL